jgi:DNA-nicking Smr family endonuclease
MNTKGIKPEDIELFRQQAGKVKPVTSNTIETARPDSRKRSFRTRTETARHTVPAGAMFDQPTYVPASIDISDENFIQFKRAGIQDRVFRKLLRGQIPVVAELDLHGMTIYNARIALDQFMSHIHQHERQVCIRIIHGKGYGSRDGLPVIKRQTQLWLQCNINVLAYCSCIPAEGGTGAIYVLVKNCA